MARDRKTTELLARVKSGNPDFVALLKAQLHEYHVDVVKQRDETSLRWAQGRAQELADLIDALENAAELL